MSDKKYVLITGATSGIGLETARYLYSIGYGVVLVGRNEEVLAGISKELDDSLYIVIDFENTESIAEIFNVLKKNEIVLDGMVHSAGLGMNVPVRLCKIEDMERLMKVHYYGFVELCKYFYKSSYSHEDSSIIAISSLATKTQLKGSVLYSASKNALNSAITVASKEFLKRHIRVNGLLPAYVDTRMNNGLEELIDVKERQPWGMIPPRQMAELIEFLLSDKSMYITGALIPISAGMEF